MHLQARWTRSSPRSSSELSDEEQKKADMELLKKLNEAGMSFDQYLEEKLKLDTIGGSDFMEAVDRGMRESHAVLKDTHKEELRGGNRKMKAETHSKKHSSSSIDFHQ